MKAYGYDWPYDDPIDVEIDCIRRRGKWQAQGRWYGEGFFHHYKALQSQLWPWKKWDPWSELILQNLIVNRFTILAGPANASKTHSVAAYILARYICFPVNNCSLVSSTDSRSLELRIWGEIKKLWNEALARYEDTPGRIIESKQMIVTDNKYDKATDYRNGIIAIPCFPLGTLVDTPDGKVPIEEIGIGHRVLNAAGSGIVKLTHRSVAKRLVRVFLNDGRSIDCTPSHPFLTKRGWIKAVDLETTDTVFSPDETLQIMRHGHHLPVSQCEVLPCVQRGSTRAALRLVRNVVQADQEAQKDSVSRSVLWPQLCQPLGGSARLRKANHQTLCFLREDHAEGSLQSDVLLGKMSRSFPSRTLSILREAISFNQTFPEEAEITFLQSLLCAEREESPSQSMGANTRGIDNLEAFPDINLEFLSENGIEVQRWQASLAETRCGLSAHQARRGTRRWSSQDTREANQGSAEDSTPKGTRVDSVKILEPRSDPRFDQSRCGYPVCNLEVGGHPSYSVNNVIVHNCMVGGSFVGLGKYVGIKSGAVFLAADELQFMATAFGDGISNMSKNAGFKGAGCLNPKDRTDTAGKLAEPEGGWETYAPTGKTMIWKTRFVGGKCIQLDGRDSPNNTAKDGEGWPFPHLINREDIQRDIAYYGEDSIQVSMMDYGIFPKDAQARRVITRSMCERHRAQEEPIWSHEPLLYLFVIDAAYGAVGGDRCVGIEMAFGKCADGVVRLAFVGQPNVIPVKNDLEDDQGKPILPESQIVRWVRAYCENPMRLSPIPLGHIGFDSTGRGSLVKAFADEWGNEFHAVEFGGPPSDRPVSAKIQTPCNIYYFNMVSELWFNVSTLILADQCRALPTAVMEEFCMRAWDLVKDKKVQVEPKSSTTGKPGCKQRMGRSPDLADCATVGVEVAQRIGFQLGQGGEGASKQTPRWLQELLERQKEVKMSHRLQYR